MSKFEVVVTAHNRADRTFWAVQIAEKMVDFVGGVSVYEGKGGWRSPDTGTITYEEHTLLRSFVDEPTEMFDHLKPTLKKYRESAEQEVVFIVVDDSPYSLNEAVFDALFDEAFDEAWDEVFDTPHDPLDDEAKGITPKLMLEE